MDFGHTVGRAAGPRLCGDGSCRVGPGVCVSDNPALARRNRRAGEPDLLGDAEELSRRQHDGPGPLLPRHLGTPVQRVCTAGLRLPCDRVGPLGHLRDHQPGDRQVLFEVPVGSSPKRLRHSGPARTARCRMDPATARDDRTSLPARLDAHRREHQHGVRAGEPRTERLPGTALQSHRLLLEPRPGADAEHRAVDPLSVCREPGDSCRATPAG